MKFNKDEISDRLIADVLRANRPTIQDPGPARHEFEKRRLLGRLSETPEPFVQTPKVGLVFAIAAGFALLLGLGFFLNYNNKTKGEINLAGEWHVTSGDAVADGAHVRVPTNKKATLVLKDGTQIWADSGARFNVIGDSISGIKLESGRILLSIKPQNKGTKFHVYTEAGEVQVKGTIFSVSVVDAQTTVRLHKGKVSFVGKDHIVSMRPGHKVVATEAGLQAMQTFGVEEANDDYRLGDLQHDAPQIATITKDQKTQPSQSELPSDVDTLFSETKTDDVEVLEKTVVPKTQKRLLKKSAPTLKSVQRLWKKHQYKEVLTATSHVHADAGLLFYRAQALEKLRRWREAGETYGSVAGLSPQKKAESLYRGARAFNRAHAFQRSLDLANQAIQLGGPNADHAWRVKIGALTGQKKYQQAARSATGYLSAFPSGAHVAEAQYVRGTGLRLQKNWTAAYAAYKGFLSHSGGSAVMREDASFYMGYCKIKSSDALMGRKLMERYLSQYPQGRHSKQARATLAE